MARVVAGLGALREAAEALGLDGKITNIEIGFSVDAAATVVTTRVLDEDEWQRLSKVLEVYELTKRDACGVH